MKNLRIVIFVDSRYRDTYGAIFLKRELNKINPDWNILLVSFDLWKETIDLFKPHVAFLNHMIGKRSKLISDGVDFTVVLPTEGRPNTVEQLDWYVTEQDGKCDLFLSWNETVSNKFKNTNIVTVGSPRYDIYHDYPNLIDTKEKARAKLGLDQDRDVVGVFTSFPQAKFSFQNVKFNQRDWEDLGVTKISTRKNPLEFARKEYRERLKFLTQVGNTRLLDDFHQYIIKPHPMEDVLESQTFAEQYGMSIVTQAAIHNVLAACDFVVNRASCMTSIDAYLMGIPQGNIETFGDYEADGLAKPEENMGLGDFVKLCGLHQGGAAKRAAKAFADALPTGIVDRPYTMVDRINLETLITNHSRANSVPNPLLAAVGKAATGSYIQAVEAIVEEQC